MTVAGTTAPIISISATNMMVTVPAAPAGTVAASAVAVTVTTPMGCSASANYTYN